MEPQCIVALPSIYDQKILDNTGEMVEAAANFNYLCVRTVTNHEDNNSDLMRVVDTICLPVEDTLRFIMMVACVTQFSHRLDEDTREILRSIETIARHEILRHTRVT